MVIYFKPYIYEVERRKDIFLILNANNMHHWVYIINTLLLWQLNTAPQNSKKYDSAPELNVV